jgi:hypothetical protein
MSLASDLAPSDAEQLIFSQFVSFGFPQLFSKIVTGQSGHETNGWTSDVWYKDNNGFGFGFSGSDYYYYDSVEANTEAVAAYIQGKIDDGVFPDPSTITSAAQWAALLKQAGYYTDSQSNYAAGIERWFNNNLVVAASISGGLVIFAILALYALSVRKSA